MDEIVQSNGHCSLSLVVPCYNEEQRLEIERFRQFLKANSQTAVIFVDDGSRDNTIGILERLCQGYESNTAIVRCVQNAGKAEAVRRGLLYALESRRQDFIGFWDADLATPLETIDRFLTILQDRPNIEMIFGSRVKLLGRSIHRRAIRHYLGRIFATAVSMMLKLAIYDTQCGAKIFRVKPETKQLLSQPFLSKWVFDVELIARYLNFYHRDPEILAQKIYEYPLEIWTDVAGSKVRATDLLTAFKDVVRIKLRYLS